MEAVTDAVKQKIWAGIEQKMGIKVDDLQVYPDPERRGVYAIRADFGQIFEHFELVGYSEQTSGWIAERIEQVEYLRWPPFRDLPS